MVKYCPKCGFPNPDDAKFCMRCGYQLPTIAQQPDPQPPSVPTTPPEQPKKKLPLKAIIGVVIIVIVVLASFLVLSPLTSQHGISALASTARGEFGGNWVVANCKSGTITYKGNDTYEVTYLNGTKFVVKSPPIGDLPGIKYVDLSLYLFKTSTNVPPTKVVFALVNGTVNGQKAYIFVVGAYWNTTPNPISQTYSKLKSDLSTNSGLILLSKAILSAQGIEFNVSTHGDMIYTYEYAPNPSSANSLRTLDLQVSMLVSELGLNSVNALSTFGELDTHKAIAVYTINIAPKEPQMITLAKQVESCL